MQEQWGPLRTQHPTAAEFPDEAIIKLKEELAAKRIKDGIKPINDNK
jgi:hypothetical protein